MLVKLDEALKGQPDSVISWALVAMSIAGLVVALRARPAVKLAVLAWFALP